MKFKMKIYKSIIFVIIIYISLVSQVVYANAANLGDWWDNLEQAAGSEGAGYVTDDIKGPEQIISTIIQTALTFLGVVFLILAIYGGYLWMTARGNEEQLTKAKNTLTAAIIGLIIVIGAYAISYFVIERLSKGTLEG